MPLEVDVALRRPHRRPRRGLDVGVPLGWRDGEQHLQRLRLGFAGLGSPVELITDVSDRTRAGCTMAIVWATIPPIDAPDDVGGGDLESVEQADAVVGHVRQRVRHVRHRPAGQRRLQRCLPVGRGSIELCRQAAVTVVEADDVAPTGRDLPAELGVPARQLDHETSDQQHGWIVGRPERLVLDVDELRDVST